MEDKNYISAFFDDEQPLLKAVKELKSNNIEILDVLTPFPVHGLDKALEMKVSRIPSIGFIFGVIGAIFGLGFQVWVFTSDYPLNIGGKPFLSIPSFIPVAFEVTILFSAIAMAAAFFIKSKLKPQKKYDIIDDRLTDDRFAILIDNKTDKKKVQEILKNIEILSIS
jgi:hypothetical protein